MSGTVNRALAYAAAFLAALTALWGLSQFNYLLFHTLVELFSIAVAAATFMLAWNAREFLENDYLLFLGTAYLFVGGVDLLHTLAYGGMGVFQAGGANLATQLWICGRGLESVSLMIAPVLFVRRFKHPAILFSVFAAITAALLLSVFAYKLPAVAWLSFPMCHTGQHLTSFKIVSEYVICGILILSLVTLVARRKHLDRDIGLLVLASIVVTILSELSFTLYKDPRGTFNMIGHLLKVVSFYLIYRALIATGLTKPYRLLFRQVTQSERQLQFARETLAQSVEHRTRQLGETIQELANEVRDRRAAEERVEAERARLFAVLQAIPGIVGLWGPDYRLRFANDQLREVFGDPGEKTCYEAFRNRERPCKSCVALRVLQSQKPLQWRRKTPEGRTLQVLGYPFTDSDGEQLVMELGIDITDQLELESQVLSSAEAERRRIGQDLHDSLGQMLSGISCLSQVLADKLNAAGERDAADAERIHSAVLDALDLARSLARGLNPITDRPNSLMVAMRELAVNISEMFRLDCSFHCDEAVLIANGDVAMHMYRIAQEAAHNAARHSRGAHVTISLNATDGRVELTVQDDGMGFSPSPGKRQGMGLRIMEYRAHMIEGNLTVEPGDDGGTVVTCRIPVEKTR